MNPTAANTVYTIGHSTHSWPEFLTMLQSFRIKILVDIRSMPGSRKFPQFNQDTLRDLLAEAGIEYRYLAGLGGRRKARKDTHNTRWNNVSFRGYADYMETGAFEEAVVQLEQIALEAPTVYMCSEAVWWRCHRAMVSDYLKAKGWNVLHIMAAGKAQEHKYTSPARIEGNTVLYSEEE